MRQAPAIPTQEREQITIVGEADELVWLNFVKLDDWYFVGAKCADCDRFHWLDRRRLEQRFGREQLLVNIKRRLRCTACGNRAGNRFLLGIIKRQDDG